MERLKKAINAAKALFRSVMASPKLTARATAAVPYTVRGMQFGRSATFTNGAQPADKNPEPPNQMAENFESYQEGPGIWKWRHYFDIYQRHFNRFVGREVHVLEIGIYSGGSLLMWKEYFGENAEIYGVDIHESCRVFEDERTKIFIGDQADRSFRAEVKKTAPLIDIVIDDGGHLPEQQLVTLEELLPHMRPGGVYFCEDIHHNFNDFAAYVQGLSDNLNELNWNVGNPLPAAHSTPSTFQAAINSIHLYPFAAVIEKCDTPVDDLVCPKHGTQWQPESFGSESEAKARTRSAAVH